MSYKIINFYKFVDLDDVAEIKAQHLKAAREFGLLGSIMLAPEGINASLAGTSEGLEAYIAFLRSDPRFADMEPKWSDGKHKPFRRLYIKVKPWIIRFIDEAKLTPADIHAGKRISPTEMKRLIEEKPQDVVLVDTRNWYETDYGTFAGAERLPIKNFTDFPEAFERAHAADKDKTFIFFCTGGIRCEKVAPWAESQGYRNSFQLEGGILNYFKEHGSAGYDGNCFVFDRRWLVDGDLKETDDQEFALRIQPKPLDI